MDSTLSLRLLGSSLVAWLPLLIQGIAGGAEPSSLDLKENLDLPFNSQGGSDDDEEAPEIIVFYGQQYEADGIFFCCDKSGSMRLAGKFEKLQREVIKNLQTFTTRVQFGIVFFDSHLERFPPSGRPAQATSDMKAAGMNMVLSSRCGGGTCPKPALVASLDFANQASSRRKVIIYLSDGLNSCPGLDMTVYNDDILREVRRRNTSGVRINTIALGDKTDEEWMRTLAMQNNGTFARIGQ
jgi:uncharacterized protein with von Willebrand factor type A (vWA) domain